MLATMLIGVPTGVKFFNWIATMWGGSVHMAAPMKFSIGFLSMFLIGGITGVFLAAVPLDFQLHDTYFVVGHLHYVLMGGTIFPVVAGFYYFFPLVGGKKLSDKLGRFVFWLLFIGFNVTFLPMHLTGLVGMPRRIFTYPADLGFDLLSLVSSLGAFILAAGFAVLVWDIMRPKGKEPYAERNPWGAGTLEWLAEIPDKPWGVRSIPEIDARYPLWSQPNFVRDVDEGRFYLPDAEELKRETLVTTAIDAQPIQCLRVPGPTFLTFVAAMFTGGVFIFSTYHWWTLAAISGGFALVTILIWLWTGTAFIPEKEVKDVGLGLTLPLYASGPASVGWWAMLITMLGDMTAFVALVFGYFFYWTVNEDFPPETSSGPGVLWPLASAVLLLGAWGLTGFARRWNRGDQSTRFYLALLSAVVVAVAGVGALLAGPWVSGLDPTSHVYPATVWVLVLWTAVHVVVGVIMQLYCLTRRLAGRMTARYDIDITNVALYWHFVAITVAITIAVIAGFPLVA
jgi:cytochrome c oxidase subunit I+III